MAAADYRLMTEATGQRIATALETLASTGMGLGDPVTIAHGGSGQTGITYINTPDDIIDTVNSDFAVSTAEYVQWGKVASIRFSFTKTATVTTPTDFVPCVIKSAFRPKITSLAGSSYTTITHAWLSPSGHVNMSGTWQANGTKTFIATYILP